MTTQNPINPSDSATIYQSQIPAIIQPGQLFELKLPNGNTYRISCPPGFRGGESFQVQPFEVMIPEGVRHNRRVFNTIINSQQVAVRSPPNKRPGETIIVHFPVFPARPAPQFQPQPPPPQHQPQPYQPQPQPTPPPPQRKRRDSWNPAKWQDYLTSLQKTMPHIDPTLADKVEEISPDLVPNEFLCPITTEMIMDPVVAVDGHTYERDAIEKWFETHETSPKTNEKLPSKILIPNRAIRTQIIDFITNYRAPLAAQPAASSGISQTPLQTFVFKE